MSRFNNPAKALSPPVAPPVRPAPQKPQLPAPPAAVARTAAITLPEEGARDSNIFQLVGFLLYCSYLLSGYANDWAMKLYGNKAYLSTITVVLVPIAWLICGNPFRALRHSIGFCWIAFIGWMCICVPFSVWRSGSLSLLLVYIPKCFMCFFYAVAFATTLRRCRYLMYANILGSLILLATCITFGTSGTDPENDRFQIPDSLFFANANDLALALLLGMTAFLFLFYRPGVGKRVVGSLGIVLSTVYTLKTGSRGCMLAAASVFILIFYFSKNKLKMAALSVPVLGVALLVLPASTLHRLTLLIVNPRATQVQSETDYASLVSQDQRQELFKKSLYLTITHPLFGVGPDQFAVAVDGEAQKQGKHVPWLGTHNTYTQVSSECGIPGFVFYTAVIILCLRMNYRLYKSTRDDPGLKEIAGLSLSLLAGTLIFAVGTFFFHIAYSIGLPSLSGLTLALYLAAQPALEQRGLANAA